MQSCCSSEDDLDSFQPLFQWLWVCDPVSSLPWEVEGREGELESCFTSKNAMHRCSLCPSVCLTFLHPPIIQDSFIIRNSPC